jgi:hypothetical protein
MLTIGSEHESVKEKQMNKQSCRPRHCLTALAIFAVSVTLTASSCTTQLRNEQLESVAKDWAMVIRASQVIPVYPLTEDLQPGDVLLVSTTIEDQAKLYKQKGFLPLDQHFVRLYSSGFKEFYNSRYGITDSIIPPAQWQLQDSTGIHHWKVAPRAAFPTYQFSVVTGSGLNLAIPIQGVPVALGLMNSGKASGTVTIADAFTYGLDISRLTTVVEDWAFMNRKSLRSYAPSANRHHFLRVISRVYVTGQVSVTINNDEAMSGEMAGGADRPIELLGITKGATEKNYTDAIEAINKFVSDKLPGGKIKIATASSRSVTLNETFDRPLVIGYVGFDLPILEGGRLGSPISTLVQLTEGKSIPAQPVNHLYRLASISHMHAALTGIKGPEAEQVRRELDKLAERLPDKYSFSVYEFSSATSIRKDDSIVTGTSVGRSGFSDVLDYLSNARKTTETLERYFRLELPTQPDDGSASELKKEYNAAKTALDTLAKQLDSNPALSKAVDMVFFEN